MPEKQQLPEAKRQRIESGQFIFDNDPRQFEPMLEYGVKRVNTYLELLQPIDLPDFIMNEVCATQGDSPWLRQLVGIDDEDVANFPSLLPTIICCSKLMEFVEKAGIEAPELQADLQKIVHDKLLPNVVLGVANLNPKSNVVISEYLVNSITSWYTENAFRDFESTIADLATLPEMTRARSATGLAILGALHRKFAISDPYARYYWEQLQPFLPKDVSFKMRDQIVHETVEHKDPDRLELLKKYWHSSFVSHWVATSRVEEQSKNYLTPQDRFVATSNLPTDTRTAEMRSGAAKQAEKVYAKTRNLGQRDEIINEHDRQNQQVEQVARAQQSKNRADMDTVLLAYNPAHESLYDSSDRPVKKWQYFSHKIGRLFEVSLTHVGELYRDPTPAQTNQALAAMARDLQAVLEQGQGAYVLSPAELFGPDFPSLEPIEKVSLILFTALAMSKRADRPAGVVELISHKLQSLLSQHHISHEQKVPPILEPIAINDPNLNYLSRNARTEQRLLTPENGMISADSSHLNFELRQREQLLGDFRLFFENLSSLTEKPFFRDFFNGQLYYYILLFAAGAYGALSAVTLYGDSRINFASNEFFLFIASLVGTSGLLFSSFNMLPPRNGLDSFRKETRKIDVLSQELKPELLKLIELKNKQKSTMIRDMIGLLIFFIVIGFGSVTIAELGIFHPDAVENAGNTTNNGGVSSEDSYRIPETVDIGALIGAKFQLRGQILQPSVKLADTEGETVGFQPASVFNNESGFVHQNLTNFTNVEIVDDLDHISFNQYPGYLVYKPNELRALHFPFDGYEIVKIFQKTSSITWRKGGLGELITTDPIKNIDDLEVVLITRPVDSSEMIDDSGRVIEHSERQVETYAAWSDWPNLRSKAYELNTQLLGDKPLQALHSQILSEADRLYQDFSSQKITVEQMAAAWSDMGEKYSIEFGEYVDQHRTYSLLFHVFDLEVENEALVSAAFQPDQGYHCVIGNKIFSEFMASVGINVLIKPGGHLREFDNALYSRIGHLNSIVLLPNGRVLYTDMTPSRPTPGEDLSFLEDPDESPMQKRKRILHTLGHVLAVLAAGGAGAYLLNKGKKSLQKVSLEEYVQAELPATKLESQSVLTAVEHIVAYVSDASHEDRWQEMQTQFLSREILYQTLASDALQLLTHDKSPAETKKKHSPPGLASNRIRAWSTTTQMSDEQKIRFRDGIKLVRRHLNHDTARSDVDPATLKSLSNFLKKILVETR